MNEKSFVEGAGLALSKDALFEGLVNGAKDWARAGFRNNIAEPFANTIADKHYGGLARYNPSTGGMEENKANALRAVTGQAPATFTPKGLIGRGVARFAETDVAKNLSDSVTGGDSVIGKKIENRTKGVLSLAPGGKINSDNSKIPGALWSSISDWAGKHGDLLKGLGIGAGAVGLGLLGYNALKPSTPSPQPQPALSPKGLPGREGNVYTVGN